MIKFILAVSAVFVISPAFAYDWNGAGYTVSQSEDETSSIILTDADGRSYTIDGADSLSDDNAREIEKFIKQIKLWKTISWKEMKFLSGKDDFQFSVYPTELKWRGEDLLQYIPGGMVFSYEENTLRYDFRLVKKNKFIKIHGIYIDEEILCSKISEVLKDPQSSARRRDPDFMLMTINQMQERLEKLETENSVLKRDLGKIAADQLAYQNKRMFISKKAIDPATVDTIIEIKKANPAFGQKEIEAKLSEMKIDFSSKEVEIVLGVYFNEFPK